jgi:hypothetical protein
MPSRRGAEPLLRLSCNICSMSSTTSSTKPTATDPNAG